MPYEPIVPEGHHLGTSRSVDGAVTGHIFEDGTNELKGHAAWEWVGESAPTYSPTYDEAPVRELTPEERELLEQIGALIVALAILGVRAASPHVRRWWSNTALPAVKRTWYRLTRHKPIVDDVEPVALLHVVEAELEGSPEPGSSIVLADPRFTMTSSEWSERYRAMLAAAEFRDDQARILRNAHVVDEAASVDAAGTAELTPREFADHVRGMLAAHPELLSDETVIELQRLLNKPSQ